jgi:hypothetical protein
MGRARRVDVDGTIYPALNRAKFRSRLFRETGHSANFGGRNREHPRCDKEKPTVGLGEMGWEGGCEIRTGKHDAESRSPEKRFLEHVKKSALVMLALFIVNN